MKCFRNFVIRIYKVSLLVFPLLNITIIIHSWNDNVNDNSRERVHIYIYIWIWNQIQQVIIRKKKRKKERCTKKLGTLEHDEKVLSSASLLIRSTVNLVRDKVKWNHSSHAGVDWTQLPISIRPVSPPLPCHRRSITARTVCTALHIAILFINATNPRLRVSRVCAARDECTRYSLPRWPLEPPAQNIRTCWPRWTPVNRPFSLEQFSSR